MRSFWILAACIVEIGKFEADGHDLRKTNREEKEWARNCSPCTYSGCPSLNPDVV